MQKQSMSGEGLSSSNKKAIALCAPIYFSGDEEAECFVRLLCMVESAFNAREISRNPIRTTGRPPM